MSPCPSCPKVREKKEENNAKTGSFSPQPVGIVLLYISTVEGISGESILTDQKNRGPTEAKFSEGHCAYCIAYRYC